MHRALITGASRRIGAVLAQHLHRNYDLELHARTPREEADTLYQALHTLRPDSVRWHYAELANAEARAKLAENLGKAPLELAVFNASHFEPSDLRTSASQQVAILQQALQVNLISTWDLCLRLRPRLAAAVRRSGDASVVVILDLYASYPLPGYEAYSISRAAGAMLVRSLAQAFGKEGIRVNAVAPGTVLWSEGPVRAESETQITESSALGRTGLPADVAQAVAYLAGARHTTGISLPVDGGRRL